MKLLVLLGLVAIAFAAPLSPPIIYPNNNVDILRYDNDNTGLGEYKYIFEQSDGTKSEQKGELRNQGTDNEYLAVKGYFTWIGPDGVKYEVTYTADENGYKPEIEEGPGGAVPAAVVASLLG